MRRVPRPVPPAAEADSRKERWHPSPQLMRVLDPLGETIRREGLESREVVVRIRMEAVMVVDESMASDSKIMRRCRGCCCPMDPAS